MVAFWEQTCAWSSTKQIEKGTDTNYHIVRTVISPKSLFFDNVLRLTEYVSL